MRTLIGICAALAMAGCGDKEGPPMPDAALPDAAPPDAAPPDAALLPDAEVDPLLLPDHARADAKPATRYVISAINVPDRASENDFLGFDLDNDSRHSIDNKLGSVLQLIMANSGPSTPIDVQAANDAEVVAGRTLLLAQLKTDGFTTQRDNVVQLFLGRDADANPGNNLGGAGAFTIDPASLQSWRFYGHLETDRFTSAEVGSASVRLVIGPGGALSLPLISAHLTGMVSTTGVMNAKLGGGITKTDIRDLVLPAWFQAMTQAISANPNSNEALIAKNLFDTSRDGTITQVEFDNSSTVQTFLSPDVDLLLGDGTVGQDGVKESLSIGIGITAVRATF